MEQSNIQLILSELNDIKKQQNRLERKIDVLIELMSNETDTCKKSYKDYSNKEVYELRQRTSNAKAAEILGCSVSTVRNRCREYIASLIED